jgi:hypothetical protein
MMLQLLKMLSVPSFCMEFSLIEQQAQLYCGDSLARSDAAVFFQCLAAPASQTTTGGHLIFGIPKWEEMLPCASS